jgi:hypothetical protein
VSFCSSSSMVRWTQLLETGRGGRVKMETRQNEVEKREQDKSVNVTSREDPECGYVMCTLRYRRP